MGGAGPPVEVLTPRWPQFFMGEAGDRSWSGAQGCGVDSVKVRWTWKGACCHRGPWGARGGLAGGLGGEGRSWEAGTRLCPGEKEGEDGYPGAGPGGPHAPQGPRWPPSLELRLPAKESPARALAWGRLSSGLLCPCHRSTPRLRARKRGRPRSSPGPGGLSAAQARAPSVSGPRAWAQHTGPG